MSASASTPARQSSIDAVLRRASARRRSGCGRRASRSGCRPPRGRPASCPAAVGMTGQPRGARRSGRRASASKRRPRGSPTPAVTDRRRGAVAAGPLDGQPLDRRPPAPRAPRSTTARASSQPVTCDGHGVGAVGLDLRPGRTSRAGPDEPGLLVARRARSSRRSSIGSLPVLHPRRAGVVGPPGEVEAVAAVRPDAARPPRPPRPGARGRGPARRAARRRCRRRPAGRSRVPVRRRRRAPRRRGPAASGPSSQRRAPVASREPRQASGNRDPSSSRKTAIPDRTARARRRARGARSTAASAETTPSGPSYAPPSITESRCDPVSDRPAPEPPSHQATTLPKPSASTPQVAARALARRNQACASSLGRGERLAEVAAGARPTGRPGRRSAHICSNVTCDELRCHAAPHGVHRCGPPPPDGPKVLIRSRSTAAVLDRILAATRCTRRAPGFSQGWAFLVLDRPTTSRASGAAPPATGVDAAGPLAARDDDRPGGGRAAEPQGRLPRPVRRARQGLDRPGRGALAGALLAPRHRDGVAADAADRGRRGARRLLLRHPAATRSTGSARSSACPRRTPRSARSRSGTGCPTPGRPGIGAARGRRPVEEVVHRGGW